MGEGNRRKSIVFTTVVSFVAVMFISLSLSEASLNVDASAEQGVWHYRKSHIIENATGAGANYQVMITVHYGSGTDSGSNVYLAGKCRSDFGDIRFTDDDGSTLLDYWMEKKIDGVNATFWVEVADSLSSSSASIYLYYGSPEVSTTNDGFSTFPFFDDFSLGNVSSITLNEEPTNPTRIPDDPWEGTTVTEQSDFKTESGYISWYRGNVGVNSQLGYETSVDGVTWTPNGSNPIGLTGYAYHYVVSYNGCYYLFAGKLADGNLYLYNVTTPTSPVVMNSGKPVYYHNTVSTAWDYQIFNPGVTVVDGTWHMLLEGKQSGGEFMVGYAYSTFAELNWTAHRSSSYVIGYAGNPYLTSVPERDALLSIHGKVVGSYWRIMASYARLSSDLTLAQSWNTTAASTFNISASSIHITDPCMVQDFNSTYGLMISYGYDQATNNQTYYNGTLLQFFDNITANRWTGNTDHMAYANGVMELTGEVATWTRIASSSTFASNVSVRMLSRFESRTSNKGSSIGFSDLAKGNDWIDILYYATDGNHIRSKATGITSTASNPDANWDVYEIAWIPTRIAFSKNNVSMTASPITTTVPSVSLPVMLDSTGGDGYSLFVDWVLVRNYVYPEPAQSSWSSEQFGTWYLDGGAPGPSSPPTIPHEVQASFEYIVDGNLVTFTDKSYGPVTVWIWNFGDMKGSTKQSPTHKYEYAGKYTISLTVYDEQAHSSVAQTTVTISYGPDNPIEKTPEGWNVHVTPDFVLSFSGVGLLVIGAITYVSAIFVPSIPIVTAKGRKVIGALMFLAGLYFLIFVKRIQFAW